MKTYKNLASVIRSVVTEAHKKDDPPFKPDEKSSFKKANNKNRTGMDAARALARRAMQKKMKESFDLDISEEEADDLLESIQQIGQEVEQMNEISSELAGRASNARIDRNMSGGTSHTDIRKLRKTGTTPLDQQSKTTAAYTKTLDRKNEEYEQMDEDELDEAHRRGGNRFLNTREKDAIQKKMKPLDPNATVKHKDNYHSMSRGQPHEEQLLRHIHQATGHHVHISPFTHDMHDAATGAKIAHDAYNSGGAGQYGGPGGTKHTANSLVRAVKKFHKE